jgi:DNA repair protein RecO (recombination protein O)
MPVVSDAGVVLRLSDYSETSQIITLLTAQHGLVRLIGKGVRRGSAKSFSAGLDLLELGDAGFAIPRNEAELGTLTEWRLRDGFRGLRDSLVAIHVGLYAAEMAAALVVETDPQPELFDLLVAHLGALAGPRREPTPESSPGVARAIGCMAALVNFQRGALELTGFAPELTRCVTCGKPYQRGRGAYFSASAGGLLCRGCEAAHQEKRRIPGRALLADSDSPELVLLADLLDYHLRHIVGRELRSGQGLWREYATSLKSCG